MTTTESRPRLALVPDAAPPAPLSPADPDPPRRRRKRRVSPDRARTEVQHARAMAGLNPLTTQRATPLAPAVVSPGDRYPRFGTCGTCVFLVRMQDGNKTKTRIRRGEPVPVPVMVLRCGFGDGARITGGPASEIRSWWPGCISYEPAPGAPEPEGR